MKLYNISDLTPATTPLAGTELIEIETPAGNRKVAVASISGAGGTGSTSISFEQSTPASLWTWVHGLGKRVTPICTDNYGHRLEPGFDYPDLNTVTAQFGSATSGWLYINN